MTFNYYYGNQADQFSFIRIPRVLLVDSLFAPLSIQSKLLYGVLLDRMGISMRNGWFDEENRVYIIYQISEIQEDLGFSKKKAIDYLTELEQFGLVEKKRRGRGLPSILYVKSFMTPASLSRCADMETSEENADEARSVETGTSENNADEIRSTENGTSAAESDATIGVNDTVPEGYSAGMQAEAANTGYLRSVEISTSGDALESRGSQIDTSRGSQIAPLEVPESTPLMNYNNKSYINLSNNKSNHILSSDGAEDPSGWDMDEMGSMRAYAEIIAENIELEHLKQGHRFDVELLDGIYELILETVVCKATSIVIASNEYPAELVRSKFLKLNSMHIEYVIDCFEHNSTKVRNIKKYLLAALFNAPSTISGYYSAEVHHDMPYLAAK